MKALAASRMVEAVNEKGYTLKCEAIKHLESPLFISDHARLPKYREMPGNRAPAEPAGFHQIADALLPTPT